MPAGGRSNGLSLLLFGSTVGFRTSLQTFLECLPRGASVHAPALVRALPSVRDRVLVQRRLDLVASRPYRKNDQAWIERKNGAVVRRSTEPRLRAKPGWV